MNSTSTNQSLRPKRHRVRVVLITALAYAASYVVLSRLSKAIVRNEGGGFYYVPCSVQTLMRNPLAQVAHEVGVYAFYPANLVDRLLGGDESNAIPLDSLTNSVPYEPK